jgi:hypothetical protein
MLFLKYIMSFYIIQIIYERLKYPESGDVMYAFFKMNLKALVFLVILSILISIAFGNLNLKTYISMLTELKGFDNLKLKYISLLCVMILMRLAPNYV